MTYETAARNQDICEAVVRGETRCRSQRTAVVLTGSVDLRHAPNVIDILENLCHVL